MGGLFVASAINAAAVCLFDFIICHVVNVCEQVNGRFIGVVLAVAVPMAWYAVDVFAACGAKIIFLVFHFVPFLPPFSRGGVGLSLRRLYRFG